MKEIKISNQLWSANNLNVEVFQNGEIIPQAKTSDDWKKANEEKKPVWCYYNNDSSNSNIYGKLYNWYAVNDPRGLAPIGWRIPNSKEWSEVIEYLGGKEIAGGKMKIKDGEIWREVIASSTNSSGFSGHPNGYRDEYGNFNLFGNNGFWWSATDYPENEMAFCLKVSANFTGAYYGTIKKRYGLSIRCLKN
jgi:uncharacterized protein (TIGR02145 family)